MAIQAVREFGSEFRKVDGPEPEPDLKARIADYYKADYLPRLNTLVKPRSSLKEYMPVGRGAYALQSAYVVRNQIRAGRHESMDTSADMHGYRDVHGEYHSSFQK